MPTLGIVGGVSFASTLDYYEKICKQFNEKKGELNYPEIIISSIDLQYYAKLLYEKEFSKVSKYIYEQGVEKCLNAGVDFIILASNTAHICSPLIYEKKLNFLHIADAIAAKIKAEKCHESVLFLGTLFTMSESFYIDRLKANGLNVQLPDEKWFSKIQNAIENDLSHNNVTTKTKQLFINVIKNTIERKVEFEAVILGCTEIELALTNETLEQHNLTHLKLIPSAQTHIDAIVEILLGEKTLKDFTI